MKSSSGPRITPSDLSASTRHRINSYAIAAGAAGVTLLALAQSSEAEIVYTQTNQTIGRNGTLNIDLNHDGIADFTIIERAYNETSETVQELDVSGRTGNKINCPSSFCASSFYTAAALAKGTEIGPILQSHQGHGWIGGGPMAFEEFRSPGRPYYGSTQWAQGPVTNQYLGLKFLINGEPHFGWARLSVSFHDGGTKKGTWETHLTGYAYETVTNQSINAGQTTENDKQAAAEPASSQLVPLKGLGALALGAVGIALWRRQD